jgi:hypothetical protein
MHVPRTTTYALSIAVLLMLLAGATKAQMDGHYLYRHENTFGNDAFFSPLKVIINGGFCAFQSHGRYPLKLPLWDGFKNVNRIVLDAPEVLRDDSENGGQFWSEQVVPTSLDTKKAAWWPNWKSHFLGEGLLTRQMAEWYDARGYSYPYLMGVLTVFASQYINEARENGSFTGNSVDPIADLLLFNPLGWAAFYFDPVAQFFGETLGFSNWSPMPMIDPSTGRLASSGELFAVKLDIPGTQRYRAFYVWGLQGALGISRRTRDDRSHSLGLGLRTTELVEQLDGGRRILVPTLEPYMVYFYDRNESLMLSVTQLGVENVDIAVTAYPGLFHKRLGAYVAYSEDLGLQVGLSFTGLPIGLFVGL